MGADGRRVLVDTPDTILQSAKERIVDTGSVHCAALLFQGCAVCMMRRNILLCAARSCLS